MLQLVSSWVYQTASHRGAAYQQRRPKGNPNTEELQLYCSWWHFFEFNRENIIMFPSFFLMFLTIYSSLSEDLTGVVELSV